MLTICSKNRRGFNAPVSLAILVCLLAFAFAGKLFAADDGATVERARAALALAQAQREREHRRVAIEPVTERPACHVDYKTAVAIAAKEKRQLVLWVGMQCESEPEIRDALTECVHCHLDTFNGSATPRIMLPKRGMSYAFPQSMRYRASDVTAYITAGGQCSGSECSGPASCNSGGACGDCPACGSVQAAPSFGFSGGGCANGQCGR